MGAFFTNVQVRASDRDALVEAIRQDAAARGMEVIDAARADAADRSVLVLPPDDGGWIAIYDEATEGQDGRSLAALAGAVSRAAGGPAIAITIHDSDVLLLELWRDGACVDRIDSNPDYFGGRRKSATKRAALAGDPAKWSELGDPEALRAAWSGEELFAERTLARTCAVIGCDVRRASTGHRYTVRDRGVLPEGTLTLRFRASERPPWEHESDDAPVLVVESYVEDEIALAVGDALRVSLGARSAGRASKGLAVRCWGSAVEQALVEITGFEVVVGNVLEGAKHVAVVPERTRSAAGATMLSAELPEQAIPAGTAEPYQGLQPGMDIMRAMDAMQRSKVHVNVVGRVVAAGKGELGIGLVPLEQPRDGAAGTIARLAIDPPLPRPLRAKPDVSSHALRPLAGDRYLLGMIAIDAPRSELARRAREVLAIVEGEIAPGDRVRTAIFFGDQRRPKSSEGMAKSMLRGIGLEALFSAMITEQVVTIRAGRVVLAAGTSLDRDRENERVPWLSVSIDGEGRELAPLRERLSALFDDAVRAHPAQAVITRAGWSSDSVDVTPYEQACGIAHGIATVAQWCARWVRLPGSDRLWLTRAMLERVDRAALEAIAEVREVGDAVLITLRDRADAPRLEQAIAALLPTGEESHRTVRAFHAPR